MSDNWIALIPLHPRFIPPADTHQRALDFFQSIAPDAGEIEIKLSDKVLFFDCGGNFERILCPACGQEIDHDWWQEAMDADGNEDDGFNLDGYHTPCCGVFKSLDQLQYEWPQGFAQFAIDAMNPGIGELSDQHRQEFERILGTPLRTIYQHI